MALEYARMVERRRYTRVRGPFEGHWRGGSGATECRIADVGLGGCFVETLAQPTKGEATEVTILFAPAQSMTFAGRVAYAEPGLGFAVEFDALSPDDLARLKTYLHQD